MMDGDWPDGGYPLVDRRLWGKWRGLPAPYPLVCHLLDAGAAVEVLWRDVLPASAQGSVARGLGVSVPEAGRLVAFWAALHDIGKIIPNFQLQVDGASALLQGYSGAGGRVFYPHDLASQLFLQRVLTELGYAPGLVGGASAARVAQILGGHHGCFHAVELRHGDPRAVVPELGDAGWEEQRRAALAAMRAVFDPPPAPRAIDLAAGAVVCGLVVLADWLVSQEDFLRGRLDDLPSDSGPEVLRRHRERSAEQVVELVGEAGLGRLLLADGSFAEEFPDYPPNTLQQSVAEGLPPLLSGPGLLLMMAPMGMGKTEAALHAARLMGQAAGTAGLFVTLPTMATADQMYGRVRAYTERRTPPEVGTPVTLLHAMAWLNAAYASEPAGGAVLTGGGSAQRPAAGGTVSGDDGWSRTAATDWLRGRKRPLLAPAAVGTVDQALLTVLPVQHNVLRMLGLAGKVLVVDEVHAYDAYMQYLLARLLTWLGELRVPVVLLSATLPGEVAKRLVYAYLRGSRGRRFKESREPIEIAYPGWVYVDAADGPAVTRSFEVASQRLAVDLVDVPTISSTADGTDGADEAMPPVPGGADRRAALEVLLGPVLREGGCAMVVCTTVAEAQQTYTALRRWCARATGPGRSPVLYLLHARLPARERERRTAEITAAFGRSDLGRRPTRGAILVATQVAEQSLNLDFDLVVSDLAPVAQLLQRAGRCHRHPQVTAAALRPAWAAAGPKLVVLIPRDGDGALDLPKRWAMVYSRSLLRRTYELLAARHPEPVEIPGDVQPMVEEVYAEFRDDMTDDDIERLAEQEAATGVAAVVAVKPPRQLRDLEGLTKREIDEDHVSTRLGADAVRAICCYVDDDGTRWLDPARTTPLPEQGAGRHGRFTTAQIKTVLAESIPLRDGDWRRRDREVTAAPPAWADNPHLRDLVLLPHPLDPDGTIHPVAVGDRLFRLDPTLGLVG
ncbi:MAG: CRISPR-associated endonuclease Cas3'' [Micromonosporaceae bacterium]|nr:CRISPR-associated endonuclease Cas3'' [Micromonosporaceae bacterium]